jgi:hypothetical protein
LIITDTSEELGSTKFESLSFIDSEKFTEIKNILDKQKTNQVSKPLVGNFNHFSEAKCESYDILKYLTLSFFLFGLIFLIVYAITYSRLSKKIIPNENIEALRGEYRDAVGAKINTMLISILIQHALLFFLVDQCPYKPFSYESPGERAVTILLYILYPFVQATIVLCLFYLAGFPIRARLS